MLAVLAVLGGLGWLVTLGPLKERAQALLQAETAQPVPDLAAKPIDGSTGATSAKPAWLLEKEAAEREIAQEKARQKEIEEAANAPERQKLLAEIQAQLQQLNALEEEQRMLKIEARAGTATGAANTQRIDSLQRQIDALQRGLSDKRKRAAPKAAGEPEQVQVVRDAQGARRAAVGYLTLRTYNPASAAISLDDGTSLGSTPLRRVPLDVGVHRLKVVDGEARSRLLSVTITAGRELEVAAVDVSSLPPWP